MTIHVDTSALVDALTGPRRSIGPLRGFIEDGHRLTVSSLVLYEWLRGRRSIEELTLQENLFPRDRAVPFGPEAAAIAARIYGQVRRPRGREIDLAIAACALHDGGALWTLNRADFRDIPGLSVV